MPVTAAHVLTATTPDDPSYEIQPQHWNSAHAITLNISATEISGLFSNANGISFGLSNSSITGSVATNYAGVGETVGTVAGTDLGLTVNNAGVSIAYPKWITTARASNDAVGLNTAQTNVTWTVNSSGISINASAYLTTARASTDAIGLNTAKTNVTWTVNSSGISIDAGGYAGTGFTSTTTAGTAVVGTLNTAGLSIGMPAFLTDASGSTAASLSYYANMDDFLEPGSTTVSAGGSALQVLPFVLPQAVSGGYLRVPVSMSHVSTTVAGTSVNSTFSFNRTFSNAFVIYTQGTGANSLSLRYLTSNVATWVFQTQIGAAGVGSNYTVTFNVTYPVQGATSSYTTSYAVTSGTFNVSSQSMTLFTGPRFIDIPMAFSLTAGNYWIGFGVSTNGASNAGPAAISNASMGFSTVGVSRSALTWGLPGAATNSSIQVEPGLGSWSTNANVMSTSSIGLASVSIMASNPKLYFQMIRQA